MCAVILLAAGCSRDFHEWAGPLVPVPNLTGRILRAGEPVPGEKVKLLATDGDSAVAEDRTDEGGWFGFTGVGAGAWTVEVDPDDPGDFDKAAYELRFASDDTVLVLSDIDLALAGAGAVEPEPGATIETPRLSRPVRFVWTAPEDPARTVQVRFYSDAGEPVWYSPDLEGSTEILWNGIRNRGEAIGRPVSAGAYQWRLRVVDGNGLKLSTAYRDLHFREGSR